jgi:hypothetical protein
MRLSRVCWIFLGLAIFAAPALAQTRMCLHMGFEMPSEVRRREEALAAARLINTAMGRSSRPSTQPPDYQSWEELATSPSIASLRGMGGPIGELARKVQWGTSEPLPGWQIHHVTSARAYAFSLTDARDPCGFTYYSNESAVIYEGQPLRGATPGGIVPIT